MFGLSLTKLIFTSVVVYVVWQVFKGIARRQEHNERRAKAETQKNARVEDMVQCSVCKAYVASGSKACGQKNCPFLG